MPTSAHLTADHFARYRNRSMSPAELLSTDSHISACEACRSRLFNDLAGVATLKELRADFSEHLTYEQLVASLDDPDAEVSAHLAECEMCAEELADLQQFHRELRSGPIEMPRRGKPGGKPRWYMPVAAAAALTIAGGIAYQFRRQAPVQQPQQVARETALPPGQQAAIQEALATHTLPRPEILEHLATKQGILLGAPPAAKIMQIGAPIGTTILTDRPIFKWTPLPGATRTVVAVFDENFVQVAKSPAIDGGEWQPEQPLPRGKVLNWQVSTTVGGEIVRAPIPPAPEARFEVVAQSVSQEIETARRDHPQNHLLLAVLCARAGAVADAALELNSLAATDPATAESLRASLSPAYKP